MCMVCLGGGKMKYSQKQMIGLIYQLMFSVATVIAFVLVLIEPEFGMLINVMLAFLMFGMAYNNVHTFKRKYFTVAYLVIAALCLLLVVV